MHIDAKGFVHVLVIGRKDQLLEGAHAMRQSVFQIGIYFAEGLTIAVRNEDRIIAESACPAWRPDHGAEDLALENSGRAMWHGKGERAGEIRAPVIAAACFKLALHPLHGKAEVLGRSTPAGRVDTWRAVQA